MICEHQTQSHVRDYPTKGQITVLVCGWEVAVDRTKCHLGGLRPWTTLSGS